MSLVAMQHNRMNWLDFFLGGDWLAPKVIRVQDTVPLWSCFFSSQAYFPRPLRFYDSFERLYQMIL